MKFLKKIINKVKNEKGISLVGVMIAMIIIALALTTGLKFMSNANQYTSVARHEVTASYLAEEGLELVKNLIYAKNIESYQSGGEKGYDTLKNFITTSFDETTKNNKIITIAMDYKTPANSRNWTSSDLSTFNNSQAGLCLTDNMGDPPTFKICPVNTNINNKDFFIRKISLIYVEGVPEDGADCNGAILIRSEVFWNEPWDPNKATDFTDFVNNPSKMYNAKTLSCIYDWQ